MLLCGAINWSPSREYSCVFADFSTEGSWNGLILICVCSCRSAGVSPKGGNHSVLKKILFFEWLLSLNKDSCWGQWIGWVMIHRSNLARIVSFYIYRQFLDYIILNWKSRWKDKKFPRLCLWHPPEKGAIQNVWKREVPSRKTKNNNNLVHQINLTFVSRPVRLQQHQLSWVLIFVFSEIVWFCHWRTNE